MDDRKEEEHDFKKTLRSLPSDNGADALMRDRKSDAEFAYETLAVNASMGMFGMEENLSELMRLQMAQELLYKFDPPSETVRGGASDDE